jgi:CheY-like chemotaxis protein
MSPQTPVLIIDDNTPVLDVLSRSLQALGYDVDQATCGVEGIKKLNENDYCLIFTDYLMPDKTGKDVLIQAKKNHTKAPVVGMSGTPWLLHDGGFDAVLEKPFSITELKNVTQRFTK